VEKSECSSSSQEKKKALTKSILKKVEKILKRFCFGLSNLDFNYLESFVKALGEEDKVLFFTYPSKAKGRKEIYLFDSSRKRGSLKNFRWIKKKK